MVLPANGEPTVTLVIHRPIKMGQELLNNYGAKPNSEFLLGYGFTLPNNPEDTIVLKVGGIPNTNGNNRKWDIRRDPYSIDGLWAEIVEAFVASKKEEKDGEEALPYEHLLDAADMLKEMIRAVLDRLPGIPDSSQLVNVRPDVFSMFTDYIQGQQEVLASLMDYARRKEQMAVEEAQGMGIDIILESDESEESA